MRILALDTTEDRLSLALDDGARVRCLDRSFSKPHDETLFPQVRALLCKSGLDLKGIEGIAASSGPGRFTGIRVGLTFAAILGRVLRVPVAALSKFEALAWRLSSAERPGKAAFAWAVFSAKGSEYYLQELRIGKDKVQTAGEPFWVKADEGGHPGLRSRLRSRHLCGPAAGSLADLLGLPVWGGPESRRPVVAADLLGPARKSLSRGGAVPKPLYLRPARFEKPK